MYLEYNIVKTHHLFNKSEKVKVVYKYEKDYLILNIWI